MNKEIVAVARSNVRVKSDLLGSRTRNDSELWAHCLRACMQR